MERGVARNPESQQAGSIAANVMVTLNGVAGRPESWQFAYASPEMMAVIGRSLGESKALLLGRRTYEEFVGYWPHVSAAENPMSPAMNELTKYVVTSTKAVPSWANTELVYGQGQLEQVCSLRDQLGGEMSIIGSPNLVRSLLEARMLDRLSLMVFPLIVESGDQLFEGIGSRNELELVSSVQLPKGVLHLEYRPMARAGEESAS